MMMSEMIPPEANIIFHGENVFFCIVATLSKTKLQFLAWLTRL